MLQHLIRYYLNLQVTHLQSGIIYRQVAVKPFSDPVHKKFVLLLTYLDIISKTKLLSNIHSDITYTSFHVISAPSVSTHWHLDISICPAITHNRLNAVHAHHRHMGIAVMSVFMGNQIQHASRRQDLRHQQLWCCFLSSPDFCVWHVICIFVLILFCHHQERTNADPLDPSSRNELSQSPEFSGPAG